MIAAKITLPVYIRKGPGRNFEIIGAAQPGGAIIEMDGDEEGESWKGISKWHYKFNDKGEKQWYWGGRVQTQELFTARAGVKKDWGFVKFEIDKLWLQSRGKNVKVALLDSGLMLKHPEFINKTNITYYNAITGDQTAASCQDVLGHGTDCAGILCAQSTGVAPDIDLLVIKIHGDNGIDSNAVLKGLQQAILSKADIISMSFMIAEEDPDPLYKSIHDTIIDAFNKRITIVCASNEDGDSNFPTDVYPASFPECLSVGGITKTGVRSRDSGKSRFLDIMGPGEEIQRIFPGAALLAGTSFSTPFVAGVTAILISVAKKKQLSPKAGDIHNIIKNTANKQIPDYTSIDYGSGIIDPVKALSQINSTVII